MVVMALVGGGPKKCVVQNNLNQIKVKVYEPVYDLLLELRYAAGKKISFLHGSFLDTSQAEMILSE